MIMGFSELEAFREIFSNEKVEALVTTMEDIIPAKKSGKTGQEEVLQI
jgi:hypothetical protein